MLLEYCIVNNHSVQPYEYLSTEPLVEKRKLLRFRSRSTTRTYLWKLHHAAAGYADISENKADCRDELLSVSLSQLCTDIRRTDSIEIPAHKNNRAGSSMDI